MQTAHAQEPIREGEEDEKAKGDEEEEEEEEPDMPCARCGPSLSNLRPTPVVET